MIKTLNKIMIHILLVGILINCNQSKVKNNLDNIDSISLIENTRIIENKQGKKETLLIEGKDIWIRNAPSKGNVVMKLNTGDECEILEKGKYEEIRGMCDYWYKIKYNEKEGWVFGSQTSLSTKIYKTNTAEEMFNFVINELGKHYLRGNYIFDKEFIDRPVSFPTDIEDEPYDELQNYVTITDNREDVNEEPVSIACRISYQDSSLLIISFIIAQGYGLTGTGNLSIVCFRENDRWIPSGKVLDFGGKNDMLKIQGEYNSSIDLTGDEIKEFVFEQMSTYAGCDAMGYFLVYSINAAKQEIKQLQKIGEWDCDCIHGNRKYIEYNKTNSEIIEMIITEYVRIENSETGNDTKTEILKHKYVWDVDKQSFTKIN